MKSALSLLIVAMMVFPVAASGADYLDLDKKGNIKGWATDDGDTVRFYDKHNNPKGWYDRNTNTTFDKNNSPTGSIYDFDKD